MNEKVMVNEKLKCILYTIFSNYNNLSNKIYIVLDDRKNSEKMSEDILKNHIPSHRLYPILFLSDSEWTSGHYR